MTSSNSEHNVASPIPFGNEPFVSLGLSIILSHLDLKSTCMGAPQEHARAIAKWFKKNGGDMPVYAQRFGESVLAVKTEEEIAEPRNRRAI